MGKEAGLALEIVIHCLMVIEMIRSTIGENPDIEMASLYSVLMQGMGGDLHDDMGDPLLQHVLQHLLEVIGFGGCRCRPVDGSFKMVVDGSDNAGFETGPSQDGFGKICRGGFPIRAGDADKGHFGRGVPEVSR